MNERWREMGAAGCAASERRGEPWGCPPAVERDALGRTLKGLVLGRWGKRTGEGPQAVRQGLPEAECTAPWAILSGWRLFGPLRMPRFGSLFHPFGKEGACRACRAIGQGSMSRRGCPFRSGPLDLNPAQPGLLALPMAGPAGTGNPEGRVKGRKRVERQREREWQRERNRGNPLRDLLPLTSPRTGCGPGRTPTT